MEKYCELINKKKLFLFICKNQMKNRVLVFYCSQIQKMDTKIKMNTENKNENKI